MTLNANSLLCHQSYACFDQMAEAESRGFRYKVALYLSCLHIEFDDEITGNVFEFQALFAARFRSYWDL